MCHMHQASCWAYPTHAPPWRDRKPEGKRRRTTCSRGHALEGENVVMSRGKRECRTCRSARARARWAMRVKA